MIGDYCNGYEMFGDWLKRSEMSPQTLKGFIGGECSNQNPKNTEVEQDSSTAESVSKICGARTAASEASCHFSGIWGCSTEDQVRHPCVAGGHVALGSADRAAGVQLKALFIRANTPSI